MLETREERVKLLREGVSGKEIEMLYITGNKIRIVRTPHIMILVDINIPWDSNNCIGHEATAGCS